MKRQERGAIEQKHGPGREGNPPAPCGVSRHDSTDSHDPADGGVFCSPAWAGLHRAVRRTGAALSVGLEPAPDYLPARGFEPNIAGYERFLRGMIDATADIAPAYKFNLAFFESQGGAGWAMLERVRSVIPPGAFVIADAKRGDIGTTARHYARALFDTLGADAATVNPLMGRDSAMPFLEFANKATYFLALTSNPGADDFLTPNGLYRDIVASVREWGGERQNAGIVVGATRAARVREIREIAGPMPMLVPGVGAQGGDLETTVAAASCAGARGVGGVGGMGDGACLIHVTRGVLPGKDEAGDAFEIVRTKTMAWRERIRAAAGSRGEVT